jgi:beta-glucosidase
LLLSFRGCPAARRRYKFQNLQACACRRNIDLHEYSPVLPAAIAQHRGQHLPAIRISGNSHSANPSFLVKWYDAENKPVLFPFGFGLSYTTYAYSDLKVNPGKETIVTFMVKNTGSRAGDEIAQVYAALPASAGEPPKRLVGFCKIHLNPGESREVTVKVPAEYLSIYGENPDGWKLVPGSYTFMAGPSSTDLPLSSKVELK